MWSPSGSCPSRRRPSPDMKFQLGLDLAGLTSCSEPDNDSNIAFLIRNLSKYPNVVAISVGNETTFFPSTCPSPASKATST